MVWMIMENLLKITVLLVALALTASIILAEARPVGAARPRRGPSRDRDAPGATPPRTTARAAAIGVAAPSESAPLTSRLLVGVPTVRPDPERLIQTEVVELSGPSVRLGAFIRLALWVTLAGVGIGLTLLGGIRGITMFFDSLGV